MSIFAPHGAFAGLSKVIHHRPPPDKARQVKPAMEPEETPIAGKLVFAAAASGVVLLICLICGLSLKAPLLSIAGVNLVGAVCLCVDLFPVATCGVLAAAVFGMLIEYHEPFLRLLQAFFS